MTPEQMRAVKSALFAIRTMPLSSEEKLAALRDLLRVALPPESPLAKLASGDDKRDIDTLISSFENLLPAFAEPTRTNEDLETQVRLALNERFMSSMAFKAVAGALAIAATLFTFGLFNLQSSVQRADQAVQKMNAQVAETETLMNTKKAALDQGIAASELRLQQTVGAAITKAQDAQKDSLKALNENLSQQITEVATERKNAIDKINSTEGDAEKQLSARTAAAEKNLGIAENGQIELLRRKAQQIIEDLEEPTIHNVLGHALGWMAASFVISLLALGIAIKRR